MINRVPRLKARIVGGSTSSVKKIVSVVATLDMRSSGRGPADVPPSYFRPINGQPTRRAFCGAPPPPSYRGVPVLFVGGAAA